MKTSLCLIFRRGLFFVLLGANLCLAPLSHGAGLTLNPTSISNTYSGAVTLQISGLTNGETVLIERFLDANGNSTIDPGELLVQSFTVTDGVVTAFGGVRDTNVPGDDDGATNAIQTSVNFSSGPEFSRAAGQQLFRVSSPTARFTAVVQPWMVTQAAFAQRITGTVTNSSGAAVPAAFVALLVQAGNNQRFVAGLQADASGNFSINAATNSYMLIAAKNGFVADFGAAPMVTLNPNQVATQNVGLTPGTQTISGRVTDENTGNGIPAIQLFFDSSNNKFAVAFTDPNGNFSASALPDQWNVDISDFSLSAGGYLRPQNKANIDTTGGSVSGVNIPLAKEAALIYGSVRNDTNAPLPGISLFGNDNNNQYQASATTDANGNYTMGVTAGAWFIEPDSQNPGLAGYIVQGTNVTLTNGQAMLVNFVAQRSTAHLFGRVTDTGGSPISGLTLLAFPQNGGSSASAITDSNGNFDLGVFGGTWTVQLESGSAAQNNVIGPTLQFTVTDGVNIPNINYVVRQATATISGTVTNSNGQPLANVNVNGFITVNGTNYSSYAQTDGTGHYQLSAFTNATWQVSLDCFGLSQQGYGCPNFQNVTISGANGVANFAVPPAAQLTLHFRHFANAGDFGSGFILSPAYPVVISSYAARLDVTNDSNFPPVDQVLFTGPPGSGLNGSQAVNRIPDTNSAVYFSSRVTSPPTAPGGNWSVNYKFSTTSFNNVPNPQAAARLVIPLPTVSVNSGQLQSLSWVYKDPNTGGTLSPAPAFVTSVLAQIFDRDLNIIDNSPLAPPSTVNYTLASPIPWTSIGRIRMVYVDTQTNAFFVTFNKASADLTGASRPANGQFQFTLNGLAGLDYVVEYSTTLTNWFPLFTTNAPGSAFNIIDPNATAQRRFYRVHTP